MAWLAVAVLAVTVGLAAGWLLDRLDGHAHGHGEGQR